MRRIAAVLIAAAACLAASPAQAGSWVFARSYYSHSPVQRVEVGRRPHRSPYFTSPQGVYHRSGLRYMNSTTIIHGQTYDNLRLYEGWTQFGEQF